MRRLFPLILLALATPPDSPVVGKGQAETAAGAKAIAPLKITREERAMLLGYSARAENLQLRAEVAQLRAELGLPALAREQSEYLTKVATRLGIEPAKLASDYTVNVDTLAVEPRAAPAAPKR